MRRGLLTFEYLSRRTSVKPCRKLTIAKAAAGGSKKAAAGAGAGAAAKAAPAKK